jgi:ABC-type branched-subunit amino acid transport system ATPase component
MSAAARDGRTRLSRPPPAAAGGDAAAVIEIRGLTRRFARGTVLDGIDLAIGRGERAGLRGPNGCGKTTLLRCPTGTLTPTEGRHPSHSRRP